MLPAYGYIGAGDTVTVVGASGTNSQIIYPLSAGGYKCAWATLSTSSTDTLAVTTLTLAQLQEKFPSGKYWNHYVNSTSESYNYYKDNGITNANEDSTSSTACWSHSASGYSGYVYHYDCNRFDGATQCNGFAYKLAYDAYGTKARTWGTTTSISSLKAGDVVHYYGAGADTTWGHWVFVIGVSGSTITVGECNYGGYCLINWGRSFDLSNATSFTIYSAPYELSSSSASTSYEIDSRYPTPFKAHTLSMWTSSNGKTPVYNAVNGAQDGNIYNGYNDGDDECTIEEVYTNGWCKVSVPGISGSRYCELSVFINSGSYTPASTTVSSQTITYTRSDGSTTYGYIGAGDTVTKVGSSGSYTQVIYPLSAGGYKCAWAKLSTSSSVEVDSSYPTPFVANTLLWWNTTDGKTPVYDAINGNQSGNIYNGYNDEDDNCTVEEVYTNGWCKITVPGLSGYRYCELSVFVNVINGYNIWTVTAPAWAQCYRRWDHGSPAGYVDAGDYIYIISETDSMYQVVYPTSSGYYCRWIDRCSLSHTYTASVTDPTCTSQGYTTHTCSVCGDSYVDNYTNATGHSYYYSESKVPTISATGTLTGTCSKCSGTTTITLPKLNTTDYTYEVVTTATCDSDGTGRYTWKTTTYGTHCFYVTINKTGHSYSYAVTKEPTTSATGTLTGTCSNCSGTTTITLPKLSTTDYSYAVVTAATCTTNGTGRYTWKTTTYGTFTFDVTINKTGHSYTYAVTKAPTTSAAGTLTGTCSNCSGTTTITLPKLSTTDYSYSVVTAATCTTNGTGRYTWKTTTYGTFTFDVTINKTGHSYSYAVTKAPTTSATGTLTGTCSKCSGTTTITLPKLSTTDYSYTVVTAATCTTNGTGRYTWKTTTYGTFTFDVTINKTGHSYTYAVTKAPTTSATGTLTGTCSNCSGTTTITLPKLSTTDYSYAVVTAATCTTNGTGRYTWNTTTYGTFTFDVTINKTGHSYGSWQVTKQATCTEAGQERRDCANCDHFETRSISKLSHSQGNSVRENIKDATCEKAGSYDEVVYCTSCGTELSRTTKTIAAKGHTAGTPVQENISGATCTKAGSYDEVVYCTDCGMKLSSEHKNGTTLPHTPGDAVKENSREATCTSTGSYDEVVCCTACGAELSRKTVSVSALGHNYEDGTCTHCGAEDPGYVAPSASSVSRLAGSHRWATAIKVADEMKSQLGRDKFDAIIIASGNDFADALAGSYLATVKNAPILLSWGRGGNYAYLDTNNIDYIKANLAENGIVYILGGTSAVPASYEIELAGYTVKRLGGANRFETNLMILNEAGVSAGDEILVCTATNFADSLSASATGKPILLVWNEGGKLFDVQKEYLAALNGNSFCVIGGENAVSASLAAAFMSYGSTTRLAGANRFETSVLVAEKYFDTPTSAVLAYAWNYPDGLCGGALAYSMDVPLILTMTRYEAAAEGYVSGKNIHSGVVLGSSELISDASVRAIYDMAETDEIIVK